MQRALLERVTHLRPPQRDIKPVLIPTYCGTTNQPNLTALLALLLRRYEIPVLLHGTLEGHGGVATAYVLREFNIFPSGSAQQAQSNLDQELFAFVPTAVLSLGLAQLLALRTRLGIPAQGFLPPALIDPFAGQGLHLCNTSNNIQSATLREVFAVTGQTALLFRGTEGEPFVDPIHRPPIELLSGATSAVLFDDESSHGYSTANWPRDSSISATAKWIKQALAGKVAIPYPLLNQLACCLYASGYTKDMHQAKAIAAMSAGGLVAA
jgi:anthranilate phosphoribosyltransferase